MDFQQVVRRRRMVRHYRADPVDRAAVDRIADVYRRGPSAGFSQGQYLVVVTEEAQRRALARACRETAYIGRGFAPWISAAPVHLIPCVREADYRARYAEPDKASSAGPDAWAVPFWWIDGGAALMLLLLSAVDEGLGAGLVDIANRPRARAILELPADVEPLGLVTLGYPHSEQPPSSATRGRRALREVVHWERWHDGDPESGRDGSALLPGAQ